VIELRRAPALRGVAGLAIRSIASLVGILAAMAGKAILWSIFQIRTVASVLVTGGTGCRFMPASQCKGEEVVVKILSIGVQTVVTSQAVTPEFQEMGGDELHIDPNVTLLADRLVEPGVSLFVAVLTLEWRAVRIARVTGKGESQPLVREDDLF